MKTPIPAWLAASAGLLVSAAVLEAAIAAGGVVYSKRYETRLLSEPQPMASPAAKVEFGHKLKVDEVRGAWLRVSDGATAGWVFNGNVSEIKPADIKGLEGVPLAASQTTATAAARPLTPAASDYANRRHLGNASGDLTWLLSECHAITAEEVEKFLQEQKKGEFQ